MAHLHSVYDTDQHFKIDAITREIINQAERKNKLMQFDHNSERFTFELPRYVDGHDMTLSNQIRIHYINAGSARQQSKDVYPVYDMQLSPNDSKTVIFSWLISQNATKYAGTLNFLVEFSCVDGEGIVEYTWHTEIFKGITISTGMSNTENLVVQVSDVVAQWEQELFGVGDSVVANIEDTKNAAVSVVKAKGAETLATIPDDYNELYGMANDAIRTRANAIVSKVEGEAVTASDCSGDYLRGLRIFGKSTQDGEPSPDNPQEIHSVENAVISMYGKNLLKPQARTETINGVTFVVDKDGSVTANGTATKATFLGFGPDMKLTPGESYILSGCPEGGAFDTYMLYLHYKESGLDVYNRTGETKFTAKNEAFSSVVVIYEGITVNDLVFHPMIRYASFENTEFETYTEQTMTIPHTLSGVPVSSGGNYTDANGQQWICDEVDLARGVYVQRVKRLVLNGSETWRKSDSYLYIDLEEHAIKGGKGFCSHFVFWYNYGGDCIFASEKWVYLGSTTSANYDVDTWKEFLSENNVTLLYILADPIETALTDEEIFNFSQLHSNYPNTTILNDVGTWMEVAYNADTELYFNNSRGATDEQVDKSVDAWLTAHFTDAEEVSF